MQKMQIKTSTI